MIRLKIMKVTLFINAHPDSDWFKRMTGHGLHVPWSAGTPGLYVITNGQHRNG